MLAIAGAYDRAHRQSPVKLEMARSVDQLNAR